MDLEQALLATDQMMMDVVESDVAVLEEASRHIISAGGKRVRPRILYLSHLAAGGSELDRAVPVASALELVHTATLVHDDINDHGVTRRGRVTINEKWGRTFALLTGDYLFTQVYMLMAPYGSLNTIFAEATVALVEGETLQAQAAKDGDLNREMYQKIVAKKTASLFRAAAMLGAQLADADEHFVHNIGEYGFFLGLAFQIVDDILDLTGDPELVGKNVGIDVAQGKGVASAVRARVSNGGHVVTEPDENDPIVNLKLRMLEGGAVEEGRKMAGLLVVQANAALDKLPPSEHIDELRSILHFVVGRDH